MKRFSFRLQKLLDLSRRREEEARGAMARQLAELRAAEERLEQARKRLDEGFARMSQSLARPRIEPAEIGLLQNWLARAEKAQKSLEARLEQEERAYERARAVMIERRKELLGLERGRDKALEDWREEAGREEAAQMEEVASSRHQRQRSEG
ncbi:MAG: flagellar export protein FliJ [Planctomycetes bacterium]|nr:flagellar export protein FliJ [Planctomycetota bacterium]